MWPWGHAAVAYLVLTVLAQIHRQELPRRDETVVVLVASQLPDIIDKPLAWTVGVLPTGRSLGHSLLTALVLIAFVAVLAHRHDRHSLAMAFGIGYITHLLTDLPSAVLAGDFSRATFLLWPLLPSPVYATEPSFTAHLSVVTLTYSFLAQALAAVVVGTVVSRSLRKKSRAVN